MRKKQTWFPSLPASCPLFPTVPFFLLAFLPSPAPAPYLWPRRSSALGLSSNNRGLALPLLLPT